MLEKGLYSTLGALGMPMESGIPAESCQSLTITQVGLSGLAYERRNKYGMSVGGLCSRSKAFFLYAELRCPAEE
jgi:hypothetical protein